MSDARGEMGAFDTGRLRDCVAMKALLAALLLACPGVARAQSTDQTAAADVAFQEANRLMAQGRAAEACPKFAVSHKLDPGYGAVFNLGTCYKALGRTASAWAAFREAEALARKHGETDREAKARQRVAELTPGLMKLRVVIARAAPGLVIQRDDLTLEPALWDLPIPVDPGEHTLSASAPGKRRWTTTVTLREPGSSVVIEVPELGDDVSSKGGAPGVAPGAPASPSGMGTQRVTALGLGGIGVAGLAVGTVLGALALSKWGEAKDGHCDAANACDDRGLALHAEAMTMAHVSTAGFVVGGVGLAAATVVWLTAPAMREEKTGQLRVAPLVGTRGGGIAITGSF